MSKKLIMIYDDEARAAKMYLNRLEKRPSLKEFEIEHISNDDFQDILLELNKRRKAILDGKKREEQAIKVDDARIFIIDFRLMDLTPGLNGEEVAYNLLCFSDCRYIMGMNRYYMGKTFDLTLTGHLDSYADLNISDKDLENEGLWTGESVDYRPWYWPAILSYLNDRERQINDVMDNFDESISKVLEIPEHIIKGIPKKAGSYLGIAGDEIVKATFEDFFIKSNIILNPKERNKKFPLDRKAKIIASRLSKWIERSILPGQDIFVDAPHLITRYPSLLLGKKRSDIETWNKTSHFKGVSSLGIRYKKLKTCRFKQHWTSRPVWFWPDVSEIPKIDEVKQPWKRKNYGFVFAEDASSFYKEEECKDFISNVESPFRMRYIKSFKGVNYRPIHLLLKRL